MQLRADHLQTFASRPLSNAGLSGHSAPSKDSAVKDDRVVETNTPDDAAALARARISGRPLVLRGRVSQWPAVQAALAGDEQIADYLTNLDSGAASTRMRAPAEACGHFFYGADLRGHNFTREPTTVSAMVADLLAAPAADAPALYMGAAPLPVGLPEFSRLNPPPGVPDEAVPRLWLGNAVEVQTHFDASENLACVVAGRRVFTLFPPDQTGNLYPGPLEHTLAGQPVSMVRLGDVDERSFPRFAEAAAAAFTAELEPGDAIYIPPLWWHHVRSTGRFNVLVNYWWDAHPVAGSGIEALVHAVLAIRALPEPTRAAWRELFDHFAFGPDAAPPEHLPAHAQGILGPLDAAKARTMRSFLLGALSRR